MNIFQKAGLALAMLGAATGANAQPGRHDDGRRYDHRDDRHHQDWRNHDRGRHDGWRNHGRHCRTEWHHHHRVRICR